MGHHGKDTDVESLQKGGRRRGGCLDAFLVASVVCLFMAVAALAAIGVKVVMELRSSLETSRPPKEFQASRLTAEPGYKMQNFVYLEAISSEVKNYTMPWASVSYGPGESVGSNFDFNKDQCLLRPKKAGSYFMYIDLKLSCTFTCNPGLLSVNVGDKLTCEVNLPASADKTPVSRKCWTVSHIDGQGLVTQMTVPQQGLQNWKLELNGSGFGMFLVD